MYRFGFVIEQMLGHITHTRNLQHNLRQDTTIDPVWILPTHRAAGWLAKLPVIGSNWTVQAGLQARNGLARQAHQGKLDALFFHTQVTAVLAQDWVARIPSIVSLDATPLQYDQLGAYYHHSQGSAWLERRKWQLNRDCFRKARKLVTWSAWAKQGLVEAYEVPSDKVLVISPGVNTQFWLRSEPRQPKPDSVKILFVGGSLERKGGDLLLQAFRALRLEALDAKHIELHLVTKDTLPSEPGVFVYNAMQPNSQELRDLYHACDIFCLPTKGDCLPMVLSEAGAAGLPLLSTQVAAIPEVVQEGRNGLLVHPGDFPALKAALHCLIANDTLRRQMGLESTTIVRQNHDAMTNTLRLLDTLKEITQEHHATRINQ